MQFVKYDTFTTDTEVKSLTHVLDTHKIRYQIEELPIIMTSSLSMGDDFKEYTLKVHSDDFLSVENLHIELIEQSIKIIPEDYYLTDYSNNDLIHILKKSDEWSKYDFVIAKIILRSRGEQIDESIIQQYKTQRIIEQSIPDKTPVLLIILGYVLASSGGLFGVFIGHHLRNQKKTLSDGTVIFDYSEKVRKHGTYILLIAIPVLVYGLFIFVTRL